jgi:hypothetical protein
MGQAASLQRRAPAAGLVGNETDQLTQWLVVRQSLALTDKKMLSCLQDFNMKLQLLLKQD